MIKFEHTALYVRDLEATKLFFEQYFAATANQMYHNPRTGLRSHFLTFDGGARLEIMQRPDVLPREKSPLDEGIIHIAFSVGGREQVDALTAALRADGYEVLSGPRLTGDGYYESCIAGPEGNLIEITE